MSASVASVAPNRSLVAAVVPFAQLAAAPACLQACFVVVCQRIAASFSLVPRDSSASPATQLLPPLSPRQHQHQHSYANSTMPPQHTHAHLLQMYSQAQAEAQESSRDARVRANALAMRLGFM